MAILLANAPTDVETCQIAGCQRSHRHAEVIERTVHGFDARALFDKERRFANVRMKHPIADKSATIAHQHANFAELLGKLHARGNNGLARLFSAHNFQQPHNVRRTEEVSPDYELWPRCG